MKEALPKEVSELAAKLGEALNKEAENYAPPPDLLQLAVRERKRQIRTLVARGMPMAEFRKIFQAITGECSLDRARAVMSAEKLWPPELVNGSKLARSKRSSVVVSSVGDNPPPTKA
jgi:hypothetical protein